MKDGKWFLCLILVAALTLFSAAAAFSDVLDSAWYAPQVNAMADQGLINGYPDGTFGPERDVTRGEFAALAARSVDAEVPAAEGAYWCAATLGDLTESLPPKWRDLPLDAAHFEVPITREEAVYLLVSLRPGGDISAAPTDEVADLDAVDPDLAQAVLWAYDTGLTTGYPDGTFGPKDHLTRSQAAVLIARWTPGYQGELRQVNTWDSGGDHFTQYDLVLTARGETEAWAVKLAGDGEIQQSWNCQVQGLLLTPAGYNSVIPAGGSVTAGLIVKGGPLRVERLGSSAFAAADLAEAAEPAITPAPVLTLPVTVPVGEARPLHVAGTRLADPDGNPVQLRGVSTHGLAWFPDYVNEDAFRTLRDDWGCNVVRLAMYTAEYGGYCNGGDQEALKTLIDKGVKAAHRLGMYVIIDWHILSDGDPTTHQAEAVAFFTQMSAKYAGYDNVLYEICNEPQNAPWETVIKPYAQTVLAAIRQNDPDAIVIVGTNTWSQDVDAVIGHRLDDPNVVYSLHFYAATHKEPYRQKAQRALDAGVPVFVSECGLCDASGGGSVDMASADAWFDLLDQNGVSFVAWSLCNKNETAALIRSDCAKLSGWTEEELSQSGRQFRDMILGH